jgi:organic hydroperoxide reductase OsmC/OhrA
MAEHVHRYRARCLWEGSTAGGYFDYDRTHLASSPPAEGTLTLSADPAFRGDAARLNPEQLVVLAAASCQLLSFLASAALSKVDVRHYEDDAEAELFEGASPARITAIWLRPRIVVAPGTDESLVRRLVDKAHDGCYVAHSLNCAVQIQPEVIVAEA